MRRKGRIIPEEGPCAVMWEESSLIFLTVSSMQRGAKDRANRPIRFSFCEIFTDRVKAWTAFTRIISDFSGAENVVRSLIHENSAGEGIEIHLVASGKKLRPSNIPDLQGRRCDYTRWRYMVDCMASRRFITQVVHDRG